MKFICYLFTLQDDMEASEEVDELEEDDRDRFNDQLCSIGILGRLVPEHTIPLLAKWVLYRSRSCV